MNNFKGFKNNLHRDNTLLKSKNYVAKGKMTTFLVLMCLSRYQREKKHCYPSQETIAKYANVGRLRVNAILKELSELGVINKVNRHNKKSKKQETCLYSIVDKGLYDWLKKATRKMLQKDLFTTLKEDKYNHFDKIISNAFDEVKESIKRVTAKAAKTAVNTVKSRFAKAKRRKLNHIVNQEKQVSAMRKRIDLANKKIIDHHEQEEMKITDAGYHSKRTLPSGYDWATGKKIASSSAVKKTIKTSNIAKRLRSLILNSNVEICNA